MGSVASLLSVVVFCAAMTKRVESSQAEKNWTDCGTDKSRAIPRIVFICVHLILHLWRHVFAFEKARLEFVQHGHRRADDALRHFCMKHAGRN